MVSLLNGLQLFGGLVLLLSNGYFVAIEFAMTRVRQFEESEFTGSRGLERAWEMTERLEIYLSGCQVGITISSVGLGVVAEPALAATLDGPLSALGFTSATGHSAAAVIVALAIINLLHVVIGEQAPTYFGVERTKTAAKYGAPILYLWVRLMWPVIKISDWTAKFLLSLFGVEITRSWAEEEMEEGSAGRGELRSQMGQVLSEGGISKERREEVMSALEIGDQTVGEIMIDREDIVPLWIEDDLDENLRRMRENPHTRFPLVGEDYEAYYGIVYSPLVLRELTALERGETTLEELASSPLRLAADTSVSDAIDEFQRVGEELALVEDDGEVVGMLTPTDAWEEITGELEDPLDEDE